MKTYKDWNLDDPNEVEDFIARYGTRKNRWLANALGLRGKGSHQVANDMSAYAWNKSAAIKCRIAWHIPDAAHMYEAICDRIYNDLPKEVRW